MLQSVQTGRIGIAVFAVTILAMAAGCVRVEVPKDYFNRTDADALIGEESRASEYRRLFPTQPKLEIHGATMKLIQRLAPDSFPIRLNYAALGPETVRMRAFTPQVIAPFLDLLLVNGWMIVTFPADSPPHAYGGTTGETGSPFGRAFGVEAGDLWHVFGLGSRIGMSEWEVNRGWRTVELEPAGPADDGLYRVLLDKRTGLPRKAEWRRGDRRWRVNYEAWDWFEDKRVQNGAGGKFLMPGRLEIHSSDPKITLLLTMGDQAGYQFGATSPARQFEAPNLDRFQVYPLEMVGEALDRKMRELAKQ